MRITDVESIHLSYLVDKPFGYAWAEITTQEMILVKVHTDEGITGIYRRILRSVEETSPATK